MMKLLLWASLKPVLWGSLAAWPIALWCMQRWLSHFAYRLDAGLWMLPLASLGAIAISLLAVGVHTWAAARTRPAESLRYE